MSTTTIKTTPELREGDIVWDAGMRILIDGKPQLSRSHPGNSTYWHRGLVLNIDEVEAARFVPLSWLYDGPEGDEGEPRWTIQGNEKARWAVESC